MDLPSSMIPLKGTHYKIKTN